MNPLGVGSNATSFQTRSGIISWIRLTGSVASWTSSASKLCHITASGSQSAAAASTSAARSAEV